MTFAQIEKFRVERVKFLDLGHKVNVSKPIDFKGKETGH